MEVKVKKLGSQIANKPGPRNPKVAAYSEGLQKQIDKFESLRICDLLNLFGSEGGNLIDIDNIINIFDKDSRHVINQQKAHLSERNSWLSW